MILWTCATGFCVSWLLLCWWLCWRSVTASYDRQVVMMQTTIRLLKQVIVRQNPGTFDPETESSGASPRSIDRSERARQDRERAAFRAEELKRMGLQASSSR